MADQVDKQRWKAVFGPILAVLWTICYPIGFAIYTIVSHVAFTILYILELLYRPVGFLLQPFVYLGRFLVACLLAPFRLLVKFETLYIYLGIAAIVGLAIGLGVGYLYGSLAGILRLDAPAEQPPRRTVKQYRQTKREEKRKAEGPPFSPVPDAAEYLDGSTYISTSESARNAKGRGKRGLLNHTIMEEVDSDY